VLLEKPLGVNVAESDRIIGVAAALNLRLGVIFQSRFKSAVRRTKQFVDEDRLGQLVHVSGVVKWYRPPSYYADSDWRGRWALEGGGAIFSHAGHTLDLMRWIGGPVDWVFTNMVTAPPHEGVEVETLGTVTMRFANGATGMLEAATSLYPGKPERLEIHGTRGTITLEAGNIVDWIIQDAGPEDAHGVEPETTGSGAADPMAFPITWHQAQIADFIDAVHQGREPAVDGTEARRLNVLCEAIYRSAREGAMVNVVK
jgi:predicted dehydrogenase